MSKDIKEPPFNVVNGRKQYSFRCEVMGEFRPVVPAQPAQQGARNEQDGQNPGDTGAAPEGDANDDLVRMRVRVLSAVYTWSGTWFGPQLVDNGWNDSYALRKVAAAINNRTGNKAVPLVWDHSLEAHDICGRLSNAAWEESSDIPVGVNAYMEVPRSLDERAAALIDAGMVPATSIWWSPTQEQSHPDMPFEKFVEMQGEIVDGQPVCWRPVDLSDAEVIHHAIVWAGADPHSGPRAEQSTTNQTAWAVRNSKPQGGKTMETVAVPVAEFQALCAAHGFDVALAAGGELPQGLGERLANKAKALNELQPKYNQLAEGLQKWQSKVLKEGETTLNAAQVLERLSEVFENAEHGQAYVKSLQDDAVAWFDKANVDPANPQSLTDVQKRQRERLANCTDRQQLKDSIVENTAAAKARFGPGLSLRSSVGEELPPGTGNTGGNAGGAPMTAEERRIAASFDSLNGRRSE
jgi:hypothetical protein